MLLSASRYREPIEGLLNDAKYQRTSFHEEQKGIVDANNDQDQMQCQLNRLESQYEVLESRLAEMDEKLESALKLLVANQRQSYVTEATPGSQAIVSDSTRRRSKRIQKKKEKANNRT